MNSGLLNRYNPPNSPYIVGGSSSLSRMNMENKCKKERLKLESYLV